MIRFGENLYRWIVRLGFVGRATGALSGRLPHAELAGHAVARVVLAFAWAALVAAMPDWLTASATSL